MRSEAISTQQDEKIIRIEAVGRRVRVEDEAQFQ